MEKITKMPQQASINEQLNNSIELIEKLVALGEQIEINKSTLETVCEAMRRQELNSSFFTVAEIAEALHCTTKSAMQELRRRNVELIASGKSYIVFKDNFFNAFGGGTYAGYR